MELKKFTISYRPKGGTVSDNIVENRTAYDAATTLISLGFPNIEVFSFSIETTHEQFEAMLAQNPSQKIMSFDDWEAAYGPAKSRRHLWMRPRPPHPAMGAMHPLMNGRGSPLVCAYTSHVRSPSEAEFYGSWTVPDPSV